MATSELTRLASAVERHARADGSYETAVPALKLSRFSAPSDLAPSDNAHARVATYPGAGDGGWDPRRVTVRGTERSRFRTRH